MLNVALTAIGVGGATVIDAILGFIFKKISHKFSDIVLSFAAGVGFGSGDTSGAMMIAIGIALQNVPEGMIIIGPMLSAGVKPVKAFVIALITGLVEVVGTLLGYFAVSISSVVLPVALAFAGGTMLYVVSDEMLSETHGHGSQRGATYALLIGFTVMLITDTLLG